MLSAVVNSQCRDFAGICGHAGFNYFLLLVKSFNANVSPGENFSRNSGLTFDKFSFSYFHEIL